MDQLVEKVKEALAQALEEANQDKLEFDEENARRYPYPSRKRSTFLDWLEAINNPNRERDKTEKRRASSYREEKQALHTTREGRGVINRLFRRR